MSQGRLEVGPFMNGLVLGAVMLESPLLFITDRSVI